MKIFKTLIGIYEELKRLNAVLERAYPPPRRYMTIAECYEVLDRICGGKETPKSEEVAVCTR